MKKIVFSIISILVFAVLITGFSTMQVHDQNLRTMNVSGTGTVRIVPDIAHISIGVSSQSPDIQEALNDNNNSAATIIETLISMGVDASDIQTQNFYLYQSQSYPMYWTDASEEEPQTYYYVENTVSTTIHDLDLLGEVLTKVLEEGANTIYGIIFDVADREATLEEARSLAIKDAQEKAATIAGEAGVKLGEIYSIKMRQDNYYPYSEGATMGIAMGGGSDVPVSEGTMEINVTMYLTYLID